MKTDVNGCSTTEKGRENYETFKSPKGQTLVQYDYRTINGKLFSCIANSLEEARNKRGNWLRNLWIADNVDVR
jgi:hypothetical protein